MVSGRSPLGPLLDVQGRSAAFSPDGKRLVVHQRPSPFGAKAGTWVYDAATGNNLCQCEQAQGLSGRLEFSPDGEALLAQSPGLEVPLRIWDTTTGKVRHKLLIPADKVWDVAFSAGGGSLHIAAGKTIQVWPAGRPVPFRVTTEPDMWLLRPAASADGRRLAVLTWPRNSKADDEPHKRSALKVLDTTTGEELSAIKTLRAPVSHYVISADGKRLVAYLKALNSLQADKLKSEIVLWDVDGQKEIAAFLLPTTPVFRGKAPVVYDRVAAFGDDGRLAALSSQPTQNDCVLKVWKLADGKGVTNYQQIFEISFPGTSLGAVHFSLDGRLLFFATSDTNGAKGLLSSKEVPHIVDLKTGKELLAAPELRIKTQGVVVPGNAISPDGNLLAWSEGTTIVDGGYKSDAVVVANLNAKGRKNMRLVGHTQRVVCLAFSPDGQRLASLASPSNGGGTSIGPCEIKIWDLHNAQEVLSLTTEASDGTLQFSADGHRLFLATRVYTKGKSGCELQTWDATPLPGSVP
jgi:WD40 repeat protein